MSTSYLRNIGKERGKVGQVEVLVPGWSVASVRDMKWCQCA